MQNTLARVATQGQSTTTWIDPMNNLHPDKQIEIIAAICEGVGQRAVRASPAPTARRSPVWRSALVAAAPSCTTV